MIKSIQEAIDKTMWRYYPAETRAVLESLPENVAMRFENLASQLSPENISCDGECSRAEVRRRYNQIMREWKSLERQYGVELDPSGMY